MSVYAVSDLHGCLQLLKQIQNFIKDDDIVYCLGDCGDRGSKPFETIKAVANDKRFIYLKGNHEDMLVNAVKEYYQLDNDIGYNSFNHWYQVLIQNGGHKTFKAITSSKYCSSWCKYLKELPCYKEYINKDGYKIILTHAGFTPQADIKLYEDDYIWDRSHFNKFWPLDEEFKKTIIVHGHTPIPYIQETIKDESRYEPGAYWYCGNHKVCIDNASYFTHLTVLLDLDTFDEHIFSY